MSVSLQVRLLGDTVDLLANAGETIRSLKEKIKGLTEVDIKSFELVLDGQVLDDCDQVGECPFQDGDEVVAVVSKKWSARTWLADQGLKGKTAEHVAIQISTTPPDKLDKADEWWAGVLDMMAEADLCGDISAVAKVFSRAASHNLFQCSAVLLQRGLIDVNYCLRPETCETALHYAAFAGSDDVVQLLLKYNADWELRDAYGILVLTYHHTGETALDNAYREDNFSTVRLLSSCGER